MTNEPTSDRSSTSDDVVSKKVDIADDSELAGTKERLLRVSADLDNYRKRTRRELEEQRQYGALPVLQDFLPVVDNLQHALDAAETTGDPDEMLRGVKMIQAHLHELLKHHQCEEIEAQGTPFDPEVHEAVRQVSVPNQPAGIVVDVVQPGYRLHNRVVRPAKVVVSADG